MSDSQVVWRFRIARDQIGYVRMIVEAYDGLAVVVTPEGEAERIEWWVPASRQAEAAELELRLGRETGMTRLD